MRISCVSISLLIWGQRIADVDLETKKKKQVASISLPGEQFSDWQISPSFSHARIIFFFIETKHEI